MSTDHNPAWVLDLAAVRRSDVARVGGKNASLGEMLHSLQGAGVRVPEGFATTAQAFWAFVDHNHLREPIAQQLRSLAQGEAPLTEVGAAIRAALAAGEFPPALRQALLHAYRRLGRRPASVAVRSSATAEDLPEASFAGQQETFLNVRGEAALLDACRRCYASLFTDRAISYREQHGFDHAKVALSVGVQRMVRADIGAAGVMFSIDTESGFPRTVLIDAIWGLGEPLVQGIVEPDEFVVFKPLLDGPGSATCRPIIRRKLGAKALRLGYGLRGVGTKQRATSKAHREQFVLNDEEVLQLARWACAIERHYGTAMDIEWAKDGASDELFVVQARPETVQSRQAGARLQTYRLGRKGKVLVQGLAIGSAVAVGRTQRLDDPSEGEHFPDGAVLVARNTDPDWLPVMRRAAAVVTDHGGRTSHAAIVSRELGLPAIVGTGDAMAVLGDGREVTVSCAEGETGFVYEGAAQVQVDEVHLDDLPQTRTQVMLNFADPAAVQKWWRLPADGIGLVRMEFIVSNHIRVHPMALLRHISLADKAARRRIDALTAGWPDKSEFFVDTLARGLASIAAVLHPKPVIVRMSDFKTNEYAQLIGGAAFEPQEENPMLGWRGASRYYDPGYREGFALECRAIRRAREELGLANIIVMIPFCRTPEEADRVLATMAEEGLKRGAAGLQVYVMAEIPSNVVLAREFAQRFDGFSIGSNDLTQLMLGVDRDSERLAPLFDERHPAVTRTIATLIRDAHAAGAKVGICGQAPSDHPDFARFLVEAGIDSISVNPDSFVRVKHEVARAEVAAQTASSVAVVNAP